jgi:hypothetical protein
MKLLLVIAALTTAMLPRAALAECDSWIVEGALTIRHSDGSTVEAQLKQSGDRLSGTAWQETPASGAAVHGTIQEDGLRLRIDWLQGPRIYEGGIYADGAIDGVAFTRSTRSKVTWDSPQLAQCADW